MSAQNLFGKDISYVTHGCHILGYLECAKSNHLLEISCKISCCDHLFCVFVSLLLGRVVWSISRDKVRGGADQLMSKASDIKSCMVNCSSGSAVSVDDQGGLSAGCGCCSF
jgi:hypothetical protein